MLLRRSGDTDPSKAILAETYKLIGNSAYGKCVTDKTKHRDVKYVDERKASQLINDKCFRAAAEIEEGLYEVEMSKKIIKLNLPQHIGFFVYQYAKLRMLSFYFDFIDVFVDRSDFEYCQMDTDSAYFAISGDTLEDVIKPSMRSRFYKEWDDWLPAVACDAHNDEFLSVRQNRQPWQPHACCLARSKYDKRTPGLFKQEWEGDGFVGLCSKTYYCFGSTNKASTKGLNKQLNLASKQTFLDVLKDKKSKSGENRGFRVVQNHMFTYNQIKDGLSYFYPKRKVMSDGISTKPLDV